MDFDLHVAANSNARETTTQLLDERMELLRSFRAHVNQYQEFNEKARQFLEDAQSELSKRSGAKLT